MGDFNRYWILDGDTTTAGGIVMGSCAHIPVDGRRLALEGDQVKCPACNSVGVIKCIPPIRRSTAHDGGQFSVSGDLCLCACPVPPKLVASQKNRYMGFSAAEIVASPAALAWFTDAGHIPAAVGLDHSIRFHVLHRGSNKAMDGVPYKVTLADGSEHIGVTDANGMTATIYTNSSEPAKMEIPYHDNSNSTAINHSDGCSC